MKMSQWRWAVQNRCVFSAHMKAISDRSSDHSAGGRRFHVAGPLTAKLRCLVAVWTHGTSKVPVAADHISVAYAVTRCPSVSPSVMFVYSVTMNKKYLQNFFAIG